MREKSLNLGEKKVDPINVRAYWGFLGCDSPENNFVCDHPEFPGTGEPKFMQSWWELELQEHNF